MASQRGKVECVNAIIGSCQSLDPKCMEESLFLAGLNNHWEVAAKLLDLEPGIKYGDIFYLAATTLAQQDSLLQRIWKLAASGIPQSIRNAALYRAADNEKNSTVEWLLKECGAEPNATADKPQELRAECFGTFPSYGDALTAAAHDNNLKLIRLLLSHQALVDGPKGAALQSAARQGHLDVVELLLDRGADIDRIVDPSLMREIAMQQRSGTALQAACDYRQGHIVKRLLERGANPNHRYEDSVHTYPIISAAFNNQPEILGHLLRDKRTNVNVWGAKDGLSPLHIACERMDLASVEHLLNRKAENAENADINFVDFKGNQAIHLAAFKGDAKIVELLLRCKAKITHYSKEKGLALQQALKSKHIDCAILLADAAVPVFDSLTKAALMGNGFAESIIKDPKGKHPRLDTAKIAHLEDDIKLLQKRNQEVEIILKDYDAMACRVTESKLIAEEKIEDARKARAEARETHDKFDIAIEGFASAKKERDDLRQKCEAMRELEVEAMTLRQQVLTKDEELKREAHLSETRASELQDCRNMLQSTQDLLGKEQQHVQALQAEVDQLRNGIAPRGSVFGTTSSDAINQPGHETRQSSLSVSHRGADQTDTVSLADSDHHASTKERKSKKPKFSKLSDSFSSVSSGMAAGLGGISDDVKAWQRKKKTGE